MYILHIITITLYTHTSFAAKSIKYNTLCLMSLSHAKESETCLHLSASIAACYCFWVLLICTIYFRTVDRSWCIKLRWRHESCQLLIDMNVWVTLERESVNVLLKIIALCINIILNITVWECSLPVTFVSHICTYIFLVYLLYRLFLFFLFTLIDIAYLFTASSSSAAVIIIIILVSIIIVNVCDTLQRSRLATHSLVYNVD